MRSLLWHQGILYAGGTFKRIGNLEASGVARWDGLRWEALGPGLQEPGLSHGNALAASGPNLFVGGPFSQADGRIVEGIARWDGTDWHALASGLPFGPRNQARLVNDLLVVGDDLLTGGAFLNAGRIQGINHLALWNGSVWQSIGPSFDFRADQFRLTLSNQIDRPYRVEYSTDLVQWRSLAEYTDLTQTVNVYSPAAVDGQPQFFRAVPMDRAPIMP